MHIPPPKTGYVICYSYVWRHEYQTGQREGVKNRPAMIVLANVTDAAGHIVVTVAPITHTPPADPAGAVEIWQRTKQRLGLDGERSWIIIDDLNIFTWPGYDLRPVPGRPETCLYGPLPGDLIRQVQTAIAHRRGILVRSNRDE
jgi:hypothetical protein